MTSLRRRRYLTSVSDVCEVAPRSLFWTPNGLKEIQQVRFEFSLIMTAKWTMAFLTGQTWRVLKSWYTGGDPEQEFLNCFADGLNQTLVSTVAQASEWLNCTVFLITL